MLPFCLQSSAVQVLNSMSSPSQYFPSEEGFGVSHDLDRNRVWLPFPQLIAHALQLDHPPHSPLTLK
mgnify:CR=1 FL=1